MCRGLAVCYSDDEGFKCVGISSHSSTGDNEDFKLEIIIDDFKDCGYSVEIDEQYFYKNKLDKIVYKKHKDKIKSDGKIKEPFQKIINEWITENEIEILRWLLKNTTYMRAYRDQDLHHSTAGGNQDMRFCKAGGSQIMRYCKSGRNQDMSFCEAGGNQDMRSCKAGENQDMRYCKAGNSQNMSYCECIGERYIKIGSASCRARV